MEWAVQTDLYPDHIMRDLFSALDRYSIKVSRVYLADAQLACDAWPTGQVFAYGSHGLSARATQLQWSPGSYISLTGDSRIWTEHWGQHMLNHASVTVAFKDVASSGMGDSFIRPAEDNKYFPGQILDGDDIMGWQASFLKGEGSPVRCAKAFSLDTLVTYGAKVDIFQEYRFFIAQGHIIASSTYRFHGRNDTDRCVEDAAVAFVEQMIDLWQPAPGFVLDVARTEHGWRIVEVNAINTSGLYACDPYAFVKGVQDFLS